jgi:chromosomal replication initiation ATPase DnaA
MNKIITINEDYLFNSIFESLRDLLESKNISPKEATTLTDQIIIKAWSRSEISLDQKVKRSVESSKVEFKIYPYEQDVVDKYCSIINVDSIVLFSNIRLSDLVFYRSILMYLLHFKYGLSQVRTGMIVGGRDHTTVINACKKLHIVATSKFKRDQEQRKEIDKILEQFGFNY